MSALSRYLAPGSLVLVLGPVSLFWATKETLSMDVLLSEYPWLHPGLKGRARLRQLTAALAMPADARTVCREVFRFLATLALIAASGLVLLMAG